MIDEHFSVCLFSLKHSNTQNTYEMANKIIHQKLILMVKFSWLGKGLN